MVAVKNREAERFVSAPPDGLFLFLVYGSDSGMVRERALTIISKRVDDRHDPFQFVEMSGDAVSADPLALLDEANTTPLFGGRFNGSLFWRRDPGNRADLPDDIGVGMAWKAGF